MATGSIKKRGKNSYSVIIFLGEDASGKKHQKWYTVHGTKKDAQIFAAKKILEVEKGTIIVNDKITIKNFFEKWLNFKKDKLAYNTWKSYKTTIEKYIYPNLSNFLITKLKAVDIEELYDKCKTEYNLSNTMILYIHRILHTAFQQAFKWDFVSFNILDKVTPPKKDKYTHTILDKKQLQTLLKYLKNNNCDIYLPILIAVYSGMRKSEIIALSWNDIDFKNSLMTINKSMKRIEGKWQIDIPKTESSNRIISIPQTLLNELKLFYNNRPNSIFVCSSKNGSFISGTELNHKLTAILKELNLPHIRFHDLRHCHASILVANNVQPKIISNRLGHSNIQITMDTYSHIYQQANMEVANIFDKALSTID